MIYVGFLLLTLTLQALLRISVLDHIGFLTNFFHSHCLQRVVMTSYAAPEMKALVCGENFPSASDAEIFIASGLIHLFVVSGAHLVVLEKIVSSRFFLGSNYSKLAVVFILFIYALACEMNPPVSRSLAGLLFAILLSSRKLYWTENFKILLVGLVTLNLNPDWLASVSLQLSWLAALVVSMNQLYFVKAGLVLKQFLFFVFLWPLLIFLQAPSPAILICNLVFTPFLEFILFPLGLITWFMPFLSGLFDQIILSLKQLLQLLEFQLNAQQAFTGISVTTVGWLLLLSLHFILHFTEIHKRRISHV